METKNYSLKDDIKFREELENYEMILDYFDKTPKPAINFMDKSHLNVLYFNLSKFELKDENLKKERDTLLTRISSKINPNLKKEEIKC